MDPDSVSGSGSMREVGGYRVMVEGLASWGRVEFGGVVEDEAGVGGVVESGVCLVPWCRAQGQGAMQRRRDGRSGGNGLAAGAQWAGG